MTFSTINVAPCSATTTYHGTAKLVENNEKISLPGAKSVVY